MNQTANKADEALLLLIEAEDLDHELGRALTLELLHEIRDALEQLRTARALAT